MEENHKINILLMENEEPDKSIINLLKGFSNENQVELFIFNNPEETLGYLKQIVASHELHRHNILLFNSKPPLTSVMDVIWEIKESPDLRVTPVFIIAESLEDEDINEAYRCHLNCFIAKPRDIEGLIRIIDSFKGLWLKYVELP
jgi:CheY-like chemotaxis protein